MIVIYLLLGLSYSLIALYFQFFRDILTSNNFAIFDDLVVQISVFSVPVSVMVLTFIFSNLHIIRAHKSYKAIKNVRRAIHLIYTLAVILIGILIFYVDDFVSTSIVVNGFILTITVISVITVNSYYKIYAGSFFLLFSLVIFIINVVDIFYLINPFYDVAAESLRFYHAIIDILFFLFGFYFLQYSYVEAKEYIYIKGLDKKNIMRDLLLAIEKKQFFLEYQPQVSLQTGEVNGLEALVRWNHPTKGYIQPKDFIAIAERMQLISLITDWVLEQVIIDSKKLEQTGNPLKISVNFSTVDLTHDRLLLIEDLLKVHQLPPQYIKIEVTESIMMNDPEMAIDVLEEINSMGVNIALDDFGTGFSSLNYLKDMPIKQLKIDRSFLKDINGKFGYAIIESTLRLAKSLGIKTVAEGVEDSESLAILKEMKCDTVQGFLIAKPMPFDKLVEWRETFKNLNI